MKLLICGSRSLHDKSPEVIKHIEEFNRFNKVDVVISGMAKGADLIGAFWANDNDILVEQYYAQWDDLFEENAFIVTKKDGSQYNRNAGLERNKRMLVKGKPDFVLAFIDGRVPKSNGTRHMIRLSEEAGVPVKVIEIT